MLIDLEPKHFRDRASTEVLPRNFGDLLWRGTGKRESIENRPIRGRGHSEDDVPRTRYWADARYVWSYIAHAKSQDDPYENVERDLLASPLGRYLLDCPDEFGRMWDAAHPAKPTPETATRRILEALSAAQSDEQGRMRSGVRIEPGELTQRELRAATKGEHSVKMFEGTTRNILADMVRLAVVQRVDRIHKGKSMALYRLLKDLPTALETMLDERRRHCDTPANTGVGLARIHR